MVMKYLCDILRRVLSRFMHTGWIFCTMAFYEESISVVGNILRHRVLKYKKIKLFVKSQTLAGILIYCKVFIYIYNDNFIQIGPRHGLYRVRLV